MRKYLLLIIALMTNAGLYSQVTIGSSQTPIKGALLELTQGAITQKGLMLPRVALFATGELKMGDRTIPSSEYLEHTGLLVYNVNDVDNCPSPTSVTQGVYLWDGLQWQRQTNIEHPDVTTHYDQDGNKFLARQFGTAGTWMIENLRATKYDPKRDGTDPTNGEMAGPQYNEDYDYEVKLWAYPSPADETDPTNSSLYEANPSLGLLYTWGAASRGLGDQYHDEGGEGHPEFPVAIRQGICPSGWHLPTDKEWTLLENEIQSNTSQYSSMADIGGTGIVGESSTANLLSPLTDKCEPHPQWSVGTSKPKEKGGFASLYAGQIEGPTPVGYGQSSYYWAGSMNHYMVYSRVINAEMFGDENMQRITGGAYTMLSVRCKKN